MRGTRTGVTAGVVALLAVQPARAATYYVAPTGSDANQGTMAAPFASWARAQMAASAGDTVYFRGGRYKYTDATSTCTSPTATVDAVVLTKSGVPGNTIKYWAYPGEKPVFDFSGISDPTKYACRQSGVRVEADWLHLKGLELTGVLQGNGVNHESWCVYVTAGSNNIFELLDAHHNMGPGFFLTHGSNNTFLNCDSHENEDTLTSNGDGQSADGFGCHPKQAGDTGNVFHGCRAWWNSDDAWDFINAQEACTVEYSWAWYHGYKPDAIVNGQPVALAAGNGNGFKGGGYGEPQTSVPTPTPLHTIRFNVAFYNKANGLYANHEIVSPFFYNNTSFNNGTDVNMLGLNGATVTSVGTLVNNLAYANDGRTLLSNMSNGGPITDSFDSWDTSLNLKITDADFQSVAFAPPASCPAPYAPGGTPCCAPTDMTCFGGMASARQADGSLPVVPFLRLSATSVLIDQGTTALGFPYAGKAPDLGAFETGLPYGASDGGIAGGSSGMSGGSGGSDAGGGSGASGSGGASSSGGSTGSSGGSSNGGISDGGSSSGSSSGGSGGSGGSGSIGGGSSSGGESDGSAAGVGGSEDSGAGSSGAIMAGQGNAPPASGGCGCGVGGARFGGASGLSLAVGGMGLFRRRRVSRAKRRAAT